MKFTKMHGIGNDYVYVNCFKESITDPASVAKKVSDRHFGIGGDGLILICPSDTEDVRMRMFNADGSEGEMCGNGIRCVGKYMYDNGLTDKTEISVETLAGTIGLSMHTDGNVVDKVRVDMGEPIIKPEDIPVKLGTDTCINLEIDTDAGSYKITCVSMGNPHAVIYVDSVDNVDIEKVGPAIEKHSIFPNRVNAEFVEILDNGQLKMRVWERGSGETLACGTGACAVLAASVLNKLSKRKNTVHLLGGDLEIEWNDDNHIYMTGSATTVFEGDIKI